MMVIIGNTRPRGAGIVGECLVHNEPISWQAVTRAIVFGVGDYPRPLGRSSVASSRYHDARRQFTWPAVSVRLITRWFIGSFDHRRYPTPRLIVREIRPPFLLSNVQHDLAFPHREASAMSNQRYGVSRAASPVSEIDDIVALEERVAPEDSIGLCLSGGGFRAMLFHVGAILRLNEAQLLPKLGRISSVSGGSITAAVLGLHWKKLHFQEGVASNLDELLVKPIQGLASTTIDRSAILLGVLLPGTIGQRLAQAYDRSLFHGSTLQDLPADEEGPRFVINATSVQTGSLARFSRPYIADYKVGMIMNPTVRLADAVAASSAFPPVLSPFMLRVKAADFALGSRGPLHTQPFTAKLVLSDGGVYDNLGVETVWRQYKLVLVSDGGGQLEPEGKPAGDWRGMLSVFCNWLTIRFVACANAR